jgi:hypothetical protein
VRSSRRSIAEWLAQSSRVHDDATHIVHWTLSTEEDCDQTKLEPSHLECLGGQYGDIDTDIDMHTRCQGATEKNKTGKRRTSVPARKHK